MVRATRDLVAARIEAIPFKEGTTVTYPASAVVKSGTLSEDFILQGVHFKKGSILGFDEDGTLWRCNISEDTVINGLPCKAGSEVEFFPEGNVLSCVLSADTQIGGIHAAEGSLVMFNSNGRLFKCDMVHETAIDGYPVRSGDVCFFDNGLLSAFYLSEDFVIEVISCKTGTRVWLRKDRRLSACTAALDVIIQGVLFRAGELIVFKEDGALIDYRR